MNLEFGIGQFICEHIKPASNLVLIGRAESKKTTKRKWNGKLIIKAIICVQNVICDGQQEMRRHRNIAGVCGAWNCMHHSMR